MKFYQDRFNAGVVGSTTGIIFSVCESVHRVQCTVSSKSMCVTDTIGGLTSPWIAGPITDRLGRRGGMFIGSIIICIGNASVLVFPCLGSHNITCRLCRCSVSESEGAIYCRAFYSWVWCQHTDLCCSVIHC